MNEKQCSKCNEKLTITITPQSVHYGRLDCSNCGFMGWARNPESLRNKGTSKIRIGRKSLSQISSFHKFDNDFCFFCLRKKEQLGWNETPTIDHIKELDKGGEDKIENMQILCSSCHKLKNWARLYMNWHLNKDDDDGNSHNITT